MESPIVLIDNRVRWMMTNEGHVWLFWILPIILLLIMGWQAWAFVILVTIVSYHWTKLQTTRLIKD